MHEKLLPVLSLLVDVTSSLRDYQPCRTFSQRLLAIKETAEPTANFHKIYRNYANLCYILEEYSEAEMYFLRSMPLRDDSYSENTDFYEKLAVTYQRLRNYSNSECYFDILSEIMQLQCLKLSKSTFKAWICTKKNSEKRTKSQHLQTIYKNDQGN